MNYSKAIHYLTAAFFIVAAGLFTRVQAQNFEGVIHYQFEEMQQNGNGDFAYMIKDDKVRMELDTQNRVGAMLYLPEDSKFVVIMESMKSYISLDEKDINDTDSYSGKWKDSELEKTGATKTIAGYTCEVWKASNESGDKLTLCMAKGLGTFKAPGNPMGRQQAPAWTKQVIAEGYMPLEVIEHKGDSETVQMKATRIEEKSLADNLFTIPEGYRDMSDMMQQMMNQRKN